MSSTFEVELVQETLHAVVTDGARAVAILGATVPSYEVVAALARLGLADRVVGVFDDRTPPPLGVRPTTDLRGTAHDLVVVGSDRDKERLLRAYVAAVDTQVPPPRAIVSGTAHLAYSDPGFAEMNVPALVPSYATGSPLTREHLYQCMLAASRAGLRGTIVEFGAFKGGTTAWLARVASHLGLDGCRVVGFDSWTGFPPRRSVLDMYEHPRCVFTDVEAVRAYVSPFGVELVEGDIFETHVALRGEPLLLCFFDTDNYSPARAALTMCAEQLVVGGSIVFDHVATTPEFVATIGERMAAYELLDAPGFLHLHGTGVFTKIV